MALVHTNEFAHRLLFPSFTPEGIEFLKMLARRNFKLARAIQGHAALEVRAVDKNAIYLLTHSTNVENFETDKLTPYDWKGFKEPQMITRPGILVPDNTYKGETVPALEKYAQSNNSILRSYALARRAELLQNKGMLDTNQFGGKIYDSIVKTTNDE